MSALRAWLEFPGRAQGSPATTERRDQETRLRPKPVSSGGTAAFPKTGKTRISSEEGSFNTASRERVTVSQKLLRVQ